MESSYSAQLSRNIRAYVTQGTALNSREKKRIVDGNCGKFIILIFFFGFFCEGLLEGLMLLFFLFHGVLVDFAYSKISQLSRFDSLSAKSKVNNCFSA